MEHNALAALLAGEPTDGVMLTLITHYYDEFKAKGLSTVVGTPSFHVYQEQLFMFEVMSRAWTDFRMPKILEEYNVIEIEQEWENELAEGIVQPIRMDVILERKDDGLLFVLDYKTVAYPSEAWLKKFEVSDQTISYSLAMKERFKSKKFGGIMYEGLVKGPYRTDTAKSSKFFGKKIQTTPFAYAYKLDGPDGAIYQTEYTPKKGWVKVAGWEEMSAKAWYERIILPAHHQTGLLNELFIPVPPIEPVPRELHSWRRQQVYQELVFHKHLDELHNAPQGEQEMLKDIYFPQNRDRCFKYGPDNRCSMYDICYTEGFEVEDALESGEFIERIDHHEAEGELEVAA